MSAQPVKKTIGIIGSAIAGPTFALQILSHPALSKAYRPILFDRAQNPKHVSEADRLQTGGAAIGLFPNGIFPLFQLGLQAAINEHGVETPTASFWSATGKDFNGGRLNHIATSGYVGYEADVDRSAIIIEREALQGLLIDEIEKRGGEVFWGCALKKLERLSESKVRAIFRDDLQTVHDLDLLVGADGAFSTVRRHLLDELDPKTAQERWMPKHCGMAGIYGVTSDVSNVLDEACPRAYEQTHGIWIDNGFLSSSPTPNGGTRWDLIVSEPQAIAKRKPQQQAEDEAPLLTTHTTSNPNSCTISGPTNLPSWAAKIVSNHYSPTHTLSLLQSHLALPNPVTKTFPPLLTASKRIIHTPLYQKVWTEREIQHCNIVLIGDASRVMLPSSGQGTAFAIEDATVLANAILNNPPDQQGRFDAALKEYAGARVPRSKRMAFVALVAGRLGLGETWYWRLVRWLTGWVTKWTSPPLEHGAVRPKVMKGSWPFNERCKVEVRS